MPPEPSPAGPILPSGGAIVAFHRDCLALPGWPGDDVRRSQPLDESSVWSWIETNHRFNSRLWAEEDLARRTRVGDSEIAANKRAIDGFNQARNDAAERIDEAMLIALGLVDPASVAGDAPQSTAAPGARLNSETAGAMIDRLSILSLKVEAMTEQTRRGDIDDDHRAASQARLGRLLAQRDDLAGCFDALIADCLAGRAYFKVYRQFKMYNDPRFNPALVAERRTGG
jgi:hypothetical protein